MAKPKKKLKLAREARVPLPDEAKRVRMPVYLAPDLAPAAVARAQALGKRWSKYINDLVRADLGLES